ncbi:phasin family protein [Sphingomonas sp. RS6]
MASKGPKTTAKPAATKPMARAAKPAAPKSDVPAEKAAPAPVVEATEPVAAPAVKAPAEALAAVSQEVEATVPKTVEAAAEPAKAAAEEMTKTAETVAPAVTTSIAKEKATMETTIENGTAKAQAFFSDLNDRTKAMMEKSTKMAEEANEFAKGNLEAMVESGRIAAKGFESLGQEAAEYSRKSFETATATMKSLASVKSPTDFFKLQSDYMRSAFDSYVAETSKHAEAMMKIAGDAAQPLSNRFAVAMEKAKTAA